MAETRLRWVSPLCDLRAAERSCRPPGVGPLMFTHRWMFMGDEDELCQGGMTEKPEPSTFSSFDILFLNRTCWEKPLNSLFFTLSVSQRFQVKSKTLVLLWRGVSMTTLITVTENSITGETSENDFLETSWVSWTSCKRSFVLDFSFSFLSHTVTRVWLEVPNFHFIIDILTLDFCYIWFLTFWLQNLQLFFILREIWTSFFIPHVQISVFFTLWF